MAVGSGSQGHSSDLAVRAASDALGGAGATPSVESLPAAVFSPCRRWRYLLRRPIPTLDGSGLALFVLLNPSTADETQDDPTIRRCIDFASRFGYAELEVVNLFALRATDPVKMLADPNPVGPDNDSAILEAASRATTIIAAWGVHGAHRGRDLEVMHLLEDHVLYALERTSAGFPSHPLYLPKVSQLTPYRGRA